MNPFGISAIGNGSPNITVYGFPVNTQVTTNNITPYSNPISEGVGSATINLSNFLPYNNQACYFNISSLSDAIGGTCTPAIFTEQISVSASKRMIFTVNYTNNFAFDFDIELNIRDNTFALLDTVTVAIEQGTNTATFNYETSATPPVSYYFDFTLSDLSCAFNDFYYGFCFNTIKIETIARLSTISVEAVSYTHLTLPTNREV